MDVSNTHTHTFYFLLDFATHFVFVSCGGQKYATTFCYNSCFSFLFLHGGKAVAGNKSVAVYKAGEFISSPPSNSIPTMDRASKFTPDQLVQDVHIATYFPKLEEILDTAGLATLGHQQHRTVARVHGQLPTVDEDPVKDGLPAECSRYVDQFILCVEIGCVHSVSRTNSRIVPGLEEGRGTATPNAAATISHAVVSPSDLLRSL